MGKIKFLTLQVKMGTITIEQVPPKYREAVKAELARQHTDR